MSNLEYRKPKQWEVLAWVPIASGLYWLLAAQGAAWWLWAVLPGSLQLAAGVNLLATPGGARSLGLLALGAGLGLLFLLPAWWVAGFGVALLAGILSFLSLVTAGRLALRQAPLYLGATPPEVSTRLDLKVAVDELVLGYFVGSARLPSGQAATRACEDVMRLADAIRARGWDRDPQALHSAPPAPEETYIERGRLRGIDYEVLRFDSAYGPPDEFPNAAHWRGLANNGECQVRLLRHPGKPRPWLMCIHGYRMGMPWLDFSLFPPEYLHQKLGLNLIMPVLPLHGARRAGLRSGDEYLDGDLANLFYAQSQALWDLRRSLAWLRANEPGARVGVYGVSLGGYNAALLSCHETELDFVLAAIPLADVAHALWSVTPPAHRSYLRQQGVTEARYREVLKPVSPLTLPCRLPQERRFVVAATADRIVVPSHPLQLAQHWDVAVQWYQGSHLSIRYEHEPRDLLKLALSRAAWNLG